MRKTFPHLVHPGQKFGRLEVLGYSHSDKRWRKHYLCRCVCGVEKTVQGTLLRSGNTSSCGCAGKETARLKALPYSLAARNLTIAGYRHKAKSAGRNFDLTATQFDIIAKQNCFYCNRPPSNVCRSQHGTGDYVYNGLDRVDSRKGYSISNVVACCKQCNLAKGDRSQGEFIAWLKRCTDHLSKTVMAEQWG